VTASVFDRPFAAAALGEFEPAISVAAELADGRGRAGRLGLRGVDERINGGKRNAG